MVIIKNPPIQIITKTIRLNGLKSSGNWISLFQSPNLQAKLFPRHGRRRSHRTPRHPPASRTNSITRRLSVLVRALLYHYPRSVLCIVNRPQSFNDLHSSFFSLQFECLLFITNYVISFSYHKKLNVSMVTNSFTYSVLYFVSYYHKNT